MTLNTTIQLASYFQDVVDPNLTSNYLLLGYAVLWLIALLYVASLVSRQNNLKKELELLQQLLEDDEEQTAA